MSGFGNLSEAAAKGLRLVPHEVELVGIVVVEQTSEVSYPTLR
jgi:hypothetical protein